MGDCGHILGCALGNARDLRHADKVKEPFTDSNDPYLDLELIHWAHDACRDIDAQYDVWFKEVSASKYPTLNLEGIRSVQKSGTADRSKMIEEMMINESQIGTSSLDAVVEET